MYVLSLYNFIRTHQLRVHMSSIGHPILGDLFYAPKPTYYRSRRLLLHAEELRIYHPRLRYPMRFVAPCPFNLTHVTMNNQTYVL